MAGHTAAVVGGRDSPCPNSLRTKFPSHENHVIAPRLTWPASCVSDTLPSFQRSLRSGDRGISPSVSGGRPHGAGTGADRADDTLAAEHLDCGLVRPQVVDITAPLAFRAALLSARPWQAGLRRRGQRWRPDRHGKLYQPARQAGSGPAAVAWCLPSNTGEMDRLKRPRLRHHHVALLGQFQTGGEGAGPG
jgi:hypothetical protein